MKLSAAHLLFLALQCPLLAHAADVLPPQLPTTEDSRLVSVATSPHIWNGVTVAPDGRTFVSLTQSEGPGVSLAQIGKDGQLHPYPDAVISCMSMRCASAWTASSGLSMPATPASIPARTLCLAQASW
jgi:hypothetical protein